MRTAGVIFLRRSPEHSTEGREMWTAHYPGCPTAPHEHWLLVPWLGAKGQINLSTQAGFALHGMENLARHWGDPWYVTVL